MNRLIIDTSLTYIIAAAAALVWVWPANDIRQARAKPTLLLPLTSFSGGTLTHSFSRNTLILAVLDHPLGIGQTGDISAVAAPRAFLAV